MHAGIIPKENHLYENLRWSSTDNDSYVRNCYGGLQDTEKSGYFRHTALRKIPPFENYMKHSSPALPLIHIKKKHHKNQKLKTL